jgi:hypothetical protein
VLRLALLLLVALAGCRSSYDGPSFAGDWTTASVDSRAMTLSLSQDLGAVLDATVRGELTDARGERWTLLGEPQREGEVGVVRSEAGLRVGLRAPLMLLTDDGVREYPEGPIHWRLVRDAQDGLVLHVVPVGRFAWSDADPAERARCTFRRAASGPVSKCPCGQELRAEWRHCPGCGRAVD